MSCQIQAVLQYILVSDKIISYTGHLQPFLLMEIVIYYFHNYFINNFFSQEDADKPDVTLKDSWKFEKSGNEFRFDFGKSES